MDAKDIEMASITFSELMHMNIEDIKLCLSKENALKICANGHKTNEDAAEIMKFCIDKLLIAYDNTFFFECTELFKEIIAKSFYVENVCESNNVELMKFLDCTLKYLDYVQPLMEKNQLESSFQILEFALIFVKQTIEFSIKCRNAVPKNTISLIKLIVKLTETNAEKCKCITQNEYEFFIKFHVALISLCEVKLPPNEFMKVILVHANLLQVLKNSTLSGINYQTDEKYHQMAANNSLRLIFRYVKGFISTINKDNQTALQQKIVIYLNAFAHFLRTMEHTVEFCKHEQCAAVADFIDLYTVAKCKVKQQNSISDEINRELHSITVSLLSILKLIYKNTDIFNLLRAVMKAKPNDCVGFITDYVMISLTDQEFINQNIKAFGTLFEDLYMFIFNNKTQLHAIIELHAALVICDSSNFLYDTLKNNIFQYNYFLAHASVEVIILISHTSFMRNQPNLMLQEFNYWHRCYNTFALFSDNPKRLHVRRLLINYYNLCQQNEKLKEILCTKGHWNPNNNFKDLSIYLVCEGTKICKVLQLFATDLSKKLQKVLNGSATIEDFNTIIFQMEMLSISNFQLESKCYHDIWLLIMRIYKLGLNDIKIINRYEFFLNAAFILLKNYTENNAVTLYEDLWNIIKENNYKSSSKLMSLTSTAYFLNCCFNESTKKFHQIVEFHLTKESAFKNNKGLALIVSVKHLTQNDWCVYINKTYKSMCELAVIKHKCIEKSDLNVPVAKRKCLEQNNYDTDTKLLLNDIYLKMMQISKTKLDNEDVKNLKNLNQIINKILYEKESNGLN